MQNKGLLQKQNNFKIQIRKKKFNEKIKKFRKQILEDKLKFENDIFCDELFELYRDPDKLLEQLLNSN